MAEQKYEEDKVYLRAPHGTIWPYDPTLAKVQGYTAVVPNKAKKRQTEESGAKSETKPQGPQKTTQQTQPQQAVQQQAAGQPESPQANAENPKAEPNK